MDQIIQKLKANKKLQNLLHLHKVFVQSGIFGDTSTELSSGIA